MSENSTTFTSSPIKVAVGVVLNSSNQVLITQRKKGQHLAGLWEFPGGKIEQDERPKMALRRELAEEVALDVREYILKELCVVEHAYPEKDVKLIVFLVRDYVGPFEAKEGQLLKWVDIDKLADYEFPEANGEIIMRIHQSLASFV